VKRLASKQATNAIRRAISAGRVFVDKKNANEMRALDKRMRSRRKPDFSLTRVSLKLHGKAVSVEWGTKTAGWGEFVFYPGKDGKPRCDNEIMSRAFLKEVLCKLADEIPFDDPEPIKKQELSAMDALSIIKQQVGDWLRHRRKLVQVRPKEKHEVPAQ
jgi:hypothetical protein